MTGTEVNKSITVARDVFRDTPTAKEEATLQRRREEPCVPFKSADDLLEMALRTAALRAGPK
jgi:hypothetical protein